MQIVAGVRGSGGKAQAVVCDLSDQAQSTSLLERAATSINNAGIGGGADPRPPRPSGIRSGI